MNDHTYYREIAKELMEQGKPGIAEAIDQLLDNHLAASTAAHETRREVVESRARIADLEEQLRMVRGIRYQEMRVELPEGGYVTLRWPETMQPESGEMLLEMVDLQMKAHARYVANRQAECAQGGQS